LKSAASNLPEDNVILTQCLLSEMVSKLAL